jgi:hypothetical protein
LDLGWKEENHVHRQLTRTPDIIRISREIKEKEMKLIRSIEDSVTLVDADDLKPGEQFISSNMKERYTCVIIDQYQFSEATRKELNNKVLGLNKNGVICAWSTRGQQWNNAKLELVNPRKELKSVVVEMDITEAKLHDLL